MSFTHLQVRSGYSLMDSTISIDKLVQRAKELNFHSLALTDEHVLYGAVSFYKTCLQHGIKPIIGMIIRIGEADQEDGQVILLAKNNAGYKQLIQLSTHIQLNEKKALSEADLPAFTKGNNIICILHAGTGKLHHLFKTATHDTVFAYVEKWLKSFGKGDFYIGLDEQGEPLLPAVKSFYEQCHIPVAAINDVRYLSEKDRIAFDCLQAMKHGRKWAPGNGTLAHKYCHLRTGPEMEQIFRSVFPEAIENTEAIAGKCNVTLDFHTRMLPSYPVPDGMPAHDYLEKICRRNLSIRYADVNETIISRLDYELTMIRKMQFSDYFLIVWDFIKYAKQQNIMVGPGRGSAAGSLVAYVLGITDVDPIEHDLLFERFLNPERVSMPDIDIDFSDHRRDEVIAYVRRKYGAEHVAQIITFGTFAARSVIRELIKTLEIDQQDANFILKEIPLQSGNTIVELIKKSEDLQQAIRQSEKIKQLFSIAAKLEGLPRHISTHAAGVVISEEPLTEHVPLKLGVHDTCLTQFPMNDLETIGLLKIDFLGLRNLTLLERIIASIQAAKKRTIDLTELPENDPKTYALLQKGKTNGVFQLESQGMKNVLRQLKPTEFADIVAVNALYRPGPAEFIPLYIDRKHKREKIIYPHPDLEAILKKTYGVLVYQEQIMQIANRIAGFSLGKADILRRAVSKKQKSVMAEQKEAFINGCVNNGYGRKVSEELFDWIVKFSNYGFNKSHAVAYSKISYQLSFLKAHYPEHFFAELLSSVSNQHDKIQSYMKELKEMDIALFPPSINKSFGKYTVEKNGIRIGLLSIKGIGHQAVKEIIDARKNGPFKDLFDFCMRIAFKNMNRSTLETLVLAGTFDETYPNRASLLASIDQAMEQAELFREFGSEPSLFQDKLELAANYVDMEDFSQMKKLADEKELIGMYISSHPLKQYRGRLRDNGFVSIDEASRLVGRRIESVVIIQSLKTIRTRRGEQMAFMTVGDESNDMEAVLFPRIFREVGRWIKEEQIIHIKGKMETRSDQIQCLVDEANIFDVQALPPESQRLFIKLTVQNSEDALIFLKKLAEQYSGNTKIVVYHEATGKAYQLAKEYFIRPMTACLDELKNYFGAENIVLEE